MPNREAMSILRKAGEVSGPAAAAAEEEEAGQSEDYEQGQRGLLPELRSWKSHSDLLHGVALAPGLRRRGCAALAAASGALVVAAVVVAMGGPWRGPRAAAALARGAALSLYGDGSVCSGWELLESAEVYNAATESLLRVGAGLLGPADERYVRGSVVAAFANASWRIQASAPGFARELGDMRLTAAQRDAIMTSLRLIADPRVHSVGLDVARAIHGSARDAEGARLKHDVEEKLLTRLAHIVLLRDDVLTSPLRELWREGPQWDMALEPENVRAMRASSGLRALAGDFEPFRGASLQQISAGLEAGALEALRALLHALRLAGRLHVHEPQPPGWAAALAEGRPGQEPLSCELVTMRDNRVDVRRALFCPLRFGTQGLDALRAADEMAAAHPGMMVSFSPGAAGYGINL